MKISQSLIRNIEKVLLGEQCNLTILYEYIQGLPNNTDKLSWQKGRLFEQLLLGASRDSQEVEVILTHKTGKPSADNDHIANFVNEIRSQFDLLFEVQDVQIEIERKWRGFDLVGHLDCIALHKETGEICIVDVKFTEQAHSTAFGQYGDWNFDNVNSKWHKLQSLFYQVLAKSKYDKTLPFYFFIAGKSSSGNWVESIKVEHTADSLTNLEQHYVAPTLGYLETESYTNPNHNDYNRCQVCAFNQNCDKRIKNLQITNQIVEL